MKQFLIYVLIGLLRLFIGFLFGVAIGSAILISTSKADTVTPGQKLAIYIEAERQGAVYGLDPDLIMAVIQVESGFDIQKLGSKGERGLMQLMPIYFPEAKFDIHKNIELGVAHLSFVRANCPVNKNFTYVICYNQGLSHKPKHPTLHPYYKAVMHAYEARKTAEVSDKQR